MTTRPQALRLADEIDPLTRYSLDNLTCSVAAAELRRLHEENERLKAPAQPAKQEQGEPVAYRSRMRNRDGQVITGWVVHLETAENPDPRVEIEPLYTTPQPKQEPYGYLYEGIESHTRGKTVFKKTPEQRLETRWWREVGPVYTTPQQRKPLTDEQTEQLWERTGDYDSFCKSIEAAHGIKE